MVKFNDGASLDTGQVSDQRGSGGGGFGGGGGGGMGLPIPMGRGGGIGLIILLIFLAIQLFGGKFGGGNSGKGVLQQAAESGTNVDNSKLAAECKTGADANTKDDCRAVAFINSIQDYWANEFSKNQQSYPETITVFYSQAVQTGCGQGSAGMGPFYCPADKQVYIDLSFWQTLKNQFGTDGGAFAEAYVIAHEYGHHVQNVTGVSDRVNPGEKGPNSGAVRLELQADCYAGVWAKNATTSAGTDGQILISEITQEDLVSAMDTASKIGDDYIQGKLGGGRVDPSEFTHGTSEQRQKWFKIGYDSGQPAKCDTFAAKNLG